MAPKRSHSGGDPVQLGRVLGKTLGEVPHSEQCKAVLAIPTVIRLDDLSTTLSYNATTHSTPKLSQATDKLTELYTIRPFLTESNSSFRLTTISFDNYNFSLFTRILRLYLIGVIVPGVLKNVCKWFIDETKSRISHK